MNRKATYVIAALAFAGLGIPAAKAAVLTWDGGGGDAAWMTVANWDNGSGDPLTIGDADSLIIPAGVTSMTMDGNTALQQNNIENAASWTIQSNAFVFDGNNGTNNNFDRFQTTGTDGIHTAYAFTGASNADDAVAVTNTRIRTNSEDKVITFNNTSNGRVLLRDLGLESDGKDSSGSNSHLVFTGTAGFKVDSIRQNSLTFTPLGYVENAFDNVDIQMANGVPVLWAIPVTLQGNAQAINDVLSFNVTGGILALQAGNLLGANIPDLVALNIGPGGTVTMGGNDAIEILGGSGILDMAGLHAIAASSYAGGALQVVNWTEGVTSITFDALSDADFAGFDAAAVNSLVSTPITLDGNPAYLKKVSATTGHLTELSVIIPEALEISFNGMDALITFDSVAGQDYQLWKSVGDLASFGMVAGASGQGNGSPLTLTDINGKPAAGSKVFYLVETY